MGPTNPYAPDLGALDPIGVLAATPSRLTELLDGWTPADFERTYAPGKWHARQLLVHLLHTELAFSWRLRAALTTEAYTVQPFDQNAWMSAEELIPAAEAWHAWLSLRAVNLRLVRHLKEQQKARRFTHPTYGPWTVATLVEWLAGHDCHHLPHFERIATVPQSRP